MDDRTSVEWDSDPRPRVVPFPWASLDKTSKEEASTLRDVRRWIAGAAELDPLGAIARDLIGVPVSVRLEGVGPPARFGVQGALVVVLGGAGGWAAAAGAEARVEVEPALAASVVSRALGRRAPRAVNPSWSVPESLAGAFAAILVAAARRARNGEAIVVLDAGPASSMPEHLASPSPPEGQASVASGIAASLTVSIDGEAFAARLVVGRAAVRPGRFAWARRDLSSLGPTPLSIPIVASVAVCAPAVVDALGPGDILIASPWPLALRPGGAFCGPVLLAAPCESAVGVRALFGDDGRLVLSGEIEPLCAAEADMGEAEESAAILSALGDVPVLVRVEIGEARMSAREWASLRRGDVVTVGRRLGEQVVLRVAGVPVARGQLVDVEGEVGVRIEERLVEERTTA